MPKHEVHSYVTFKHSSFPLKSCVSDSFGVSVETIKNEININISNYYQLRESWSPCEFYYFSLVPVRPRGTGTLMTTSLSHGRSLFSKTNLKNRKKLII